MAISHTNISSLICIFVTNPCYDSNDNDFTREDDDDYVISAIHISCKRNYYGTYQHSYQLQEHQRTGKVVRSGRSTPF
jgi:hypothetical protein